jgi:L,D-transpeptidase catalytic domain
LIAVALAACVSAQPAAAQSEPLRPWGAGARFGNELLSDEVTLTRWAHAERLDGVRARPSVDAPIVARLRATTEDRRPEVYLALRSRRDAAGRLWIQIRIPMRPNGRAGWVHREALGTLHAVTTLLVIDKRRFRATLRRDGRVIWTSPIGYGAPGTPTPAGRFYIRELLHNATGDSLYGPWAFGTSAYSRLSEWPGGGVIGIHGTNAPQLIPGRPSHGCVRLPNPAITRLADLLPIGTPVLIV